MPAAKKKASGSVVLDLGQVGLEHRSAVGAKAAVLGRLMDRGLPVPPGVVVLDVAAWSSMLLRADPAALPGEAGEAGDWIARSSATDEDGELASFAGQYCSLGHLGTPTDLAAGVRHVSLAGHGARAYARARGLQKPRDMEPSPIPVLVQPQIPVLRAGVLFSVDPLGQQRLRFAVDWTNGDGLITDGASTGNMVVFDPLGEPDSRVGDDEVMAGALPRLVDATFAALAALDETRPLDLEWIVDRHQRLWIVQTRPITTLRSMPHPRVQHLLDRHHWLQSRLPVSRYAARSYMEAAHADRAAAPRYHGHFQRRAEGAYLLARRVKQGKRPEVTADDPLGYLVQWAWLRRGNLRFAAAHFPAWLHASVACALRAQRLLARDLSPLARRDLPGVLGRCLDDNRRVRRAHAAMWYPVDLIKDAADFARRFGCEAAARDISLPRRRTRRDREAAALVRRARDRRGGRHPGFGELAPAERQDVLRHLCRHPYTFQCAEEVQDLARWSSHREQPEVWWQTQAHLRDEELNSNSNTNSNTNMNTSTRANTEEVPVVTAVCGALLRLVVRRFAPLKDDRVELLALSNSAVRHVCLELEQRADNSSPAGSPGSAFRAPRSALRVAGWIFELEPAEMMTLARDLDLRSVVRHLRSVAVKRQRARVLEELAARGVVAENDPPRAAAHGEALQGQTLALGLAQGRARVVCSPAEALRSMGRGDVLVTDEIRPSFSQVMPRAAALVCRRGSPLSHGAIVARELGIPAVALGRSMDRICDGQQVEVDGSSGVVGVLTANS